jgi:hypothetical protein
VIYVGFTNGVIEVSTDGGQTFTRVAPAPAVEPWATGLSVNPANPREVAASFSYNDTRYRPAFPHAALYTYSTNPEAGSWSVITGNLPAFAVSRVVFDNGALLAATDHGVYGTGAPAGESTTWTRVGAEMPNVQVQDLDVEPDGVYAVTHGRGAWMLPAPVVSALSPNRGPVAGGTSVSITGNNLTGATAVKFGSINAASFTVRSATSIVATSPAEPAGAVNVTVTAPGGTSIVTAADRFKFAPTVDALTPTGGPQAGGTTVQVKGSGFALGTAATSFKFGAVKSPSVDCTTSTTCSVVAPSHEAATVDVQATVNNVTSVRTAADRYTYG